MHKRNIATALLGFLGLGNVFATSAGNAEIGRTFKPKDSTRFRSNKKLRMRRKEEFSDILAAEFKPPKHTKLARRAHMGEIGLPHGMRGLMVRRVGGRLRITA